MKKVIILSLILFAMLGLAQNASAEPVINAYLYNPTTDKIVLQYPYSKPAETMPLKPTLALSGRDVPDGNYQMFCSIEAQGKTLFATEAAIKVENGHFDQEIELKNNLPSSERVSWRLVAATGGATFQGTSPLTWSRLHGRVRYQTGKWHSTYINLLPIHWGAPGNILVPVADDGIFDALVPARTYAAVAVNGSGYVFDVLERWAWNYDLTRDREDLFTIGALEIYGVRAFDVKGGPNTLFVFFRPSSVGRLHRYDTDGDGVISDSENKELHEAMKRSHVAIGPELSPKDINITLDGSALQILELTQIREASPDGTWQVNYLAQCMLPGGKRLNRNTLYKVKLEVTSHEVLRGNNITEFGEASVDYFRD